MHNMALGDAQSEKNCLTHRTQGRFDGPEGPLLVKCQDLRLYQTASVGSIVP
jgi:hypothetical protein